MYQLKVGIDGLMISKVPMQQIIIAKILWYPIGFLSTKTERIVTIIGFVKNKALASANGIFVRDM